MLASGQKFTQLNNVAIVGILLRAKFLQMMDLGGVVGMVYLLIPTESWPLGFLHRNTSLAEEE